MNTSIQTIDLVEIREVEDQTLAGERLTTALAVDLHLVNAEWS